MKYEQLYLAYFTYNFVSGVRQWRCTHNFETYLITKPIVARGHNWLCINVKQKIKTGFCRSPKFYALGLNYDN